MATQIQGMPMQDDLSKQPRPDVTDVKPKPNPKR